MGILGSMWRFVSTLGGLAGSSIDEKTDAMLTTPAGIKGTFRQSREEWTKQYKEVRDAVSQLVVVIEQKTSEIDTLTEEREDVSTKMNGAIERYKDTNEEKYKEAFADAHAREGEIDARLESLQTEKKNVEQQVEGYKARLVEMQDRIKNLDKEEAEALADIISSQQVVQLNDRLSNLSTTLQDKNLQAIERKRAQLKAQARLSSELSGNDDVLMQQELMAAGKTSKSEDVFSDMLAASKKRDDEKSGGADGGQTREL